jgi:hypothetical protein
LSKNCCNTGKNEACTSGIEASTHIFPMITPLSAISEPPVSIPSCGQPFVVGSIETSVGLVPRVSSALTWRDALGTVKARWGVGRMHYTVEPGLYALGNPDSQSNILVTANYKMSFDRLREALPGQKIGRASGRERVSRSV